MVDSVVRVVDQRAIVTVAGADVLLPLAAAATLENAQRAEQALAEIEDIAANAEDAPSVLNKVNKASNGSDFADLEAVTANLLLAQLGTGAVAESVAAVIRRLGHTPEQYGAVGDGTTDDSAAFALMIAAAGAGGLIRVPRRPYKINTLQSGLDDQIWLFEGSTLLHTNDSARILQFVEKTGFKLLGHLTMVGAGTSVGAATEGGLLLDSCRDYYIQSITVDGFANGTGLNIYGGDTPPANYRGNAGKVGLFVGRDCALALDVTPGTGSEFTIFGAVELSGNTEGANIGAGNTMIEAGTAVGNTVGVTIMPGGNHGHGTINIRRAHNLQFGLVVASGVTNGMDIYGSSYDNDEWLQNCANVCLRPDQYDPGIVYMDGGADVGLNYIVGASLPGDYAPSGFEPYGFQITSTNGGQRWLKVFDCRSATNPYALINDNAPHEVRLSRAGAFPQALTSGTYVAIKWSTVEKDRDGAIDNSGASTIWTAPWDCHVDFKGMAIVECASGATLAGSTAAMFVNGVEKFWCHSISIDGQYLKFGFDFGGRKSFNAGDDVEIKIKAVGTSPVFGVSLVSDLTITQAG